MPDNPNALIDAELGVDSHRETVDAENGASECHIGNTALSSYCCIVLVIFAFLFILIGSVMIFATTRYSDEEVIRFLSRHKYLKYASPLMLSLGLLMLFSSGIYWIAWHFGRGGLSHSKKFLPKSATTYCCSNPTDIGTAPRCSLTVLRSKNYLGSAASSNNATPLLKPPSRGEAVNEEWKWPVMQITAQPPLGSFPQLSMESLSVPCDAEFVMKEQCLVHRSCSIVSSGSNEPSKVVQVECEQIHPVI